MIITETIPTILTWSEIKAHCRLDDDYEQSYLVGLGAACTEAFERETGFAAGSRSVTVTYSYDDVLGNGIVNDFRRAYSNSFNRLLLPKGPAISVTSVSNLDQTLAADQYEIRRIGKQCYIHLYSLLSTPLTVVYVAGNASVPQLAKTAVLIHVETLYRNRGATTGQQQYETSFGLQRVYDLYGAYKALVG